MSDGRSEPSKPPGDNRQQTGPARATGGGSRRTLLITLAVCVCVAVIGVSVAVFASPGGRAGHIAGAGHSPAASKTQAAQPTAPTPSSHATTRPGVTSDGVATSVLRWPPRLKPQILRWRAGPGGKALATVENHMGSAMQAAGLKLYAPMKMTCAGLASDIATAQAGPPIPAAAMQRLYAKALTKLSTAAVDCRNAISVRTEGEEDTTIHVNKALLSQSRLEFAATSRQIYRATAKIQSAHR